MSTEQASNVPSEDDEEFKREYEAAVLEGIQFQERNPKAVAVCFDRKSRRIVVDLINGVTFMFPPELIQGLSGATDDELAEVRIDGAGYILRWKVLDADHSVPSLQAGIFGSEAWMAKVRSEFGRKGGQATSEAKAAAARANGKKGGRPRKSARSG